MKKLNSRETVILFVTLGLIVFFIVYQFVIKPMHEGSVDINDQLRVDHANLMNLVGVMGSEETQMPSMVSKIEAAARDCNIHIANIQPQKSVTEKQAVFLAVELEIDGQWVDIVQFLAKLQAKPNLFFLNELNLEKYSGAVNSLRGRIVISRMSLAAQ